MTVCTPRSRWLAAFAVLAVVVVLGACSDSPPPTLSSLTATPSPESTAMLTPESTLPTPETTAATAATPNPEPTVTSTPEPARPTAVIISPAAADLTTLGSTVQLSAEVRDQESTVLAGFAVTWTTSDNSVATVDMAGAVTSVGNGTATITASAGSVSGSALVTVTQAVASVEVSPSIADLTAWGEAVQLTVEARDEESTVLAGFAVTWTTSDNSVATVDAAGAVTSVGNGTATITASAGSVSGTAVVTVSQSVASVEVSPSMVDLTSWGETVQLTAEAVDTNGYPVAGTAFSWESDNVPMATVDAVGAVTAIGNGTATITASAGSVSGSAVVVVTQRVASVEVSPSVAELTAWGEAVQLTAKARDAIGNAVAGAEFSWQSDDILVAGVDATGLVSGIGEGKTTITASAGAASGSAIVTVPPTFTLSGTVGESGRNLPALEGALVQLENGKQESTVIGPDGRYMFPNVWGTVTVRVTAHVTHVPETVEITMDEDRTLDFDLEHTGRPPYSWTTRISGRIIEPSDPARLGSVTYAGRGERRVWDMRPRSWMTINAYLFDARYAEQVVEFRVNPEFDSKEAAQAVIEKYVHALGQMPEVLLSGIKFVNINAGHQVWAAHSDGGITIHTDHASSDVLEEVMFHEATHVALDRLHRDSPGWRAAQVADGSFISTYAQDNPVREDIAESFLIYLAVQHRPERLTPVVIGTFRRTIPNRLAYFDEQEFNMSPYTPSVVQ